MAQVVVIEHFATIRTLFEEILGEGGHTIFAGADSLVGAEAVVTRCISERAVPIFIIGDLLLPRDKEELFETIATKIPHAQIVSCSSYPPSSPWFTGVHVSKTPGVQEKLLRVISLLPPADA